MSTDVGQGPHDLAGAATVLGPAPQVPAHEVTHLRPPSGPFCVGIPVLDEDGHLHAQLRRMVHVRGLPDVIIADGGSTDGSVEPERLEELGVTTLLVKTGPGRLSAQLRMLFAFAMREGYEGVVTVDGNGKDGVEAIPDFIAALKEGFDHVQGSRYMSGGSHRNTPLDRSSAVQILHAPLLSRAAGFRYTDTTNGFRAYSRRFLLDPRVRPFRDVFSRYNLHYYLAVRAGQLGYRIKEIPVRREYPAEGPTPTKIRGIGGKLGILWELLGAVRGAYDP